MSNLSFASAAFLAIALAAATGCATQTETVDAPEESEQSSDALSRPVGGGGATTKSCEDKYGDCYIDCSLKGGPYEEGCFDSCDAAYNLCKKYGGVIGGSRGVIMY